MSKVRGLTLTGWKHKPSDEQSKPYYTRVNKLKFNKVVYCRVLIVIIPSELQYKMPKRFTWWTALCSLFKGKVSKVFLVSRTR